MKHYVPNISLPLKITWKQCCSKCQSLKREIIQPNIRRILPKVNQVFYTLDITCLPNSMILSQAVLQIFFSQGPLWVNCISLKGRIIQLNFDRIVWKSKSGYLHHVSKLYGLYQDPSSSVPKYFVHKVDLLHKMPKSKNGHNSVKYLQNSANS